MSIVPFLVGSSGAGWGKSVQRLRGDCTEVVQSQCSCRTVSAAFARKSYGVSAASEQRLREEGAVTVQPLCHFLAWGLREVPVWGLCNASYRPTTCLRATDKFMIFRVVELPTRSMQNLRGRRAQESIQKSHSCLLHVPPHGGRTERGIRAGYGLRRPIAGQM